MLKQKGPRCMIYAAAMLFDCEAEDVQSFLGHDGLSGVHIQELQAFAYSRGFALVPYEPEPVLNGAAIKTPWKRELLFLKFEGLMLGNNARGNHCVAWDGEKIFDPAITESFQSWHQFWAKIPIR